MSYLRALLIAVLAVGAYALAAPEETLQVGNAVFEVPAGWQQTTEDEVTYLVPPGIAEGKTAFLAVFAGEDLQGDFRAWFDDKWTGLRGEAKLVEGGEVKTQMAAAGYELMSTGGRLQDAQGQPAVVLLFAARTGETIQAFSYMTDDETLLAKHQAGLQAFLASLTFTNLQPQTPPTGTPGDDRLSPSFTWGQAPTPTGDAGLSGAYHRLGVNMGISTVSGNLVGQLEHTYWCFLPDGRCYYSMPTEGLENFNYDYHLKMGWVFCCTYTLTEGGGSITWGGEDGKTVPFQREGEALLVGEERESFQLLDPCNGLKLSGAYRREDYQEEFGPREGLSFTPEGEFRDEGFLRAAVSAWWYADRGRVDVQPAPGSGAYRIANNSLELIYADGRKLRVSFHLAAQVSKDDVTAFITNRFRFVRVD